LGTVFAGGLHDGVVGVRLSVRPSVTFVDSVETNKPKVCSPSGSHTILVFLVFLYRMSWQYSDGDPLTGASCAGGVG